MEDNMKNMEYKKIIEVWLKRNRRVISNKMEYYLDSETFRFKFRDPQMPHRIEKELKEVPCMQSESVWGYTTYYLFLKHPNLEKIKLKALLSALESALEEEDGDFLP